MSSFQLSNHFICHQNKTTFLNVKEDIFGKEVDGLKEDVRQKVLRLIETSKKHYHNEKEEALSN